MTSPRTGAHVIRRHMGVRSRATHMQGGYDPQLAGLYGAQIDVEPLPSPDLTSGIVGTSHIQDGAVTKPLFAESLRPPTIEDSLPVLPDDAYGEGSLVFLTTDGKLYRNVADEWTAEVATVDLTGQITETQIADDSISTPKLQALAVEAGNIAANAVTAGKIAADAVTAGTIEAGAVATDELAADAVVADKIAADAVTASKIASGSIEAGHLHVSTNKNIVPNGSFEHFIGAPGLDIPDAATLHGVLPGWIDVTHPAGSQIDINTSVPGHGNNRLGLTQGPTPGTMRLWSEYQPVTPGQKYRGRYLTRGTPGNVGTANSAMWARWYDKDLVFISESQFGSNYNVGTSVTWVEKGGVVTAPANAVYMSLTCVGSGSSSANVFIGYDNVEVWPIESDLRNTSAEVEINDAGITVTDGAIVVSNPSGTVIIDGTSNIFKIIATGTSTVNGVNGNVVAGAPIPNHEASTLVSYNTGLAAAPAVHAWADSWYGIPNERHPYAVYSFDWSNDTVTYPNAGRVTDMSTVTSKQNGSNSEIRSKWITRINRSGATIVSRHYVLKEQAF